jgi:hypothetical protein
VNIKPAVLRNAMLYNLVDCKKFQRNLLILSSGQNNKSSERKQNNTSSERNDVLRRRVDESKRNCSHKKCCFEMICIKERNFKNERGTKFGI